MKFKRHELEHIFAEDLSSPVFPILANLYYENKEYERSLKVCQIGLKHDPDNYIGQYFLAKLYIKMDEIKKAERILKNILNHNSCHINAILKLINLEEKLERSIRTIKKYVKLGYEISPNNNEIKKLHKKYYKNIKSAIPKNNLISQTPKTKLEINSAMATKTMYNLLLSQKQYSLALMILDIMKKKQRNKTFVLKEMKIIKKYLHKGVN